MSYIMKTIAEVFNADPRNVFLNVVEYENSKVIGVIDDPMGMDLSNTVLSYPLEYKTLETSPTSLSYIFRLPTDGLPESRHVNCESVELHLGSSPIGREYLKMLRIVANTQMRMTTESKLSPLVPNTGRGPQ